jgi:hypothetical protein
MQDKDMCWVYPDRRRAEESVNVYPPDGASTQNLVIGRHSA